MWGIAYVRMSMKRDRPVSIWTERDLLDGEDITALVMVLATSGCAWSHEKGCTMCGYNNDSLPSVSGQDIEKQVEYGIMEREKTKPKMAKLYTSGSFLDAKEIPPESQKKIFHLLTDAGVEKILIESRPEFVTNSALEPLTDITKVELALGLESANDTILEKNKTKALNSKTTNEPPILPERPEQAFVHISFSNHHTLQRSKHWRTCSLP